VSFGGTSRAGLLKNRHELDTNESQTRAPRAGIVSREGGGTTHPTLGGGCTALVAAGAAAGGTAP